MKYEMKYTLVCNCITLTCVCYVFAYIIYTHAHAHAHDFTSVLSVLIPHPFSCENGTLSSPFNVWAFLFYSENQETLFKKNQNDKNIERKQ